MAITIERWYWIVGNKPDVVFSGEAADYVAENDAGYLSFLAAGNNATHILTDGELADVLTKRNMPAAMIAAAGWSDWGGVPIADAMMVAIAAGIEITSTGTPALNGRYYAAGTIWQQMIETAQYIATFSAFPAGLSSLDWPVVGGAINFATTVQFLSVVRGIGDYQALWQRFLNGHADTPPTTPVTIP